MNSIETRSLRLRPHQVTDLENYLPIWSTPPDPSNPASFALSPEEAWYRLLRFVGHWSHFDFGLFVVEEIASRRIIGEAGFAFFHRGLGARFDEAPEAAWRILPEYRGHGLASEAMLAAAQWLDRKHVAQRCVCVIDPANLASIKVAQRLRFKEYARENYKELPVILFERLASISTTA